MEIDTRDEELQTNLSKVQDKLDELSGLDPSTKSTRLGDIESMISNCERNVKHIELECRTIPTDDRPKYKAIIKKRKATLKQLRIDLNFAKTTDVKADGRGGVTDAAAMSNDDFMEYGANLQKESLAATDRTIEAIEQTKEVGAATAQKVHEQTQQIQRIYDELYEIDDMLQRATKIVKRMLRRTFTDKYMWCFLFLIVGAIIAIISICATIVKRMLRRTFTDKYMWCFLFLIVGAIITIIALKATGYGDNLETSVDDIIQPINPP